MLEELTGCELLLELLELLARIGYSRLIIQPKPPGCWLYVKLVCPVATFTFTAITFRSHAYCDWSSECHSPSA